MAQDTRTSALLAQLAGNDGLDLHRLLAPGHVAVAIHGDAHEAQAQLLFSFAVNLLARLHPVVQRLTIVMGRDARLTERIPCWRRASLRGHIEAMLTALKPPVAWEIVDTPTADVQVTLAIGRATASRAALHVGSVGWLAYYAPDASCPIGGKPNPVGAHAAACIGVGEVWKRLLAPHQDIFRAVPIVPQPHLLVFSTLTYQLGQDQPNPDLPETINIGRLTMVGIGAGGGASAYTLACGPELAGWLNAIDPDTVDESNLNRYIFADAADAALARRKVDIAATLFTRSPDLHVEPLGGSFGDAYHSLRVEDLRYVQAAVHSREARREIQMETPAVIWDGAAAEDGEFRVWRHVLGTTECMYCKHPPGAEDPEGQKAKQLGQLLGLEAKDCLRKLRDHEPFTHAECDDIRQHLDGQTLSFDLPTPGQRFNDWETAQCGRLPLADADDAVPVPFAPVMAGALLAGEILKENCFLAHRLQSRYWNTLVGQFMVRNRPTLQLPTAGCRFCSDPSYQDQYRRRWNTFDCSAT